MNKKHDQLISQLITAEIQSDKGDNDSAYYTLRAAVCDLLGITQSQLNELVLQSENTLELLYFF